MIIKVTQKDIDRGIQTSCRSCPVALAINRVFPDYDVRVTSGWIDMSGPRKFEEVKTPKIVSEFISRFDYGLDVKPFSFELNLVEGFKL